MNNFTREVIRLLKAANFEFHRSGKGDHQIWRNPAANLSVSVDSKIKSRNTANHILRCAGLPKAF